LTVCTTLVACVASATPDYHASFRQTSSTTPPMNDHVTNDDDVLLQWPVST